MKVRASFLNMLLNFQDDCTKGLDQTDVNNGKFHVVHVKFHVVHVYQDG